MPAGNLIVYDAAKKLLANGGLDLDTDAIKAALVLSTYTPALTHETWASVSPYEHAGANGYTAGGATLANKTVTNTGSTTTFDSDDVAWVATGGSIVARYLVFYKSGTSGALTNPLIARVLLDTTPADVTRVSGQAFTVEAPASGWLTLSGAAT